MILAKLESMKVQSKMCRHDLKEAERVKRFSSATVSTIYNQCDRWNQVLHDPGDIGFRVTFHQTKQRHVGF